MANIKSAKKRIKTNEKSRAANAKVKSSIRTASKKVVKAVSEKEAADPNAVKEMFNDFVKKIDTASRKKIIHHKTAARKKSRLAKKVNVILQGAGVTPAGDASGTNDTGAGPEAGQTAEA